MLLAELQIRGPDPDLGYIVFPGNGSIQIAPPGSKPTVSSAGIPIKVKDKKIPLTIAGDDVGRYWGFRLNGDHTFVVSGDLYAEGENNCGQKANSAYVNYAIGLEVDINRGGKNASGKNTVNGNLGLKGLDDRYCCSFTINSSASDGYQMSDILLNSKYNIDLTVDLFK